MFTRLTMTPSTQLKPRLRATTPRYPQWVRRAGVSAATAALLGLSGCGARPRGEVALISDEDGAQHRDDDADGLFNEVDQCPQAPEDMDEFEDDDGCPDDDNDQDRIVDANDQCPLAPETWNGYQDEDGCPDRSGFRCCRDPA